MKSSVKENDECGLIFILDTVSFGDLWLVETRNIVEVNNKRTRGTWCAVRFDDYRRSSQIKNMTL